MVAVETCSLSFRTDRMQKADIIATVLFGDGAAAAVLSTDGRRAAARRGAAGAVARQPGDHGLGRG